MCEIKIKTVLIVYFKVLVNILKTENKKQKTKKNKC